MARRILLFTLAAIVVLCVIGGAFLVWSTKRAEPDYSGEVSARGLASPVKVRFGPNAVPTIEAENLQDLLFAQGFLVASERMWQMDLMRRLASGRLAEVFGEGALATDRMVRTIGLAQAARASFEALEEPYRGMLEAFAAGVNSYRAQAVGRLPVEYLIARFEPAPWIPEDSLAIAEYMSWTLSFNAREELVFMRMADRLGPERARELFPTDEGIEGPEPATEAFTDSTALLERFDELLAMPARWGLPSPGAASNAWAINGERTEDGQALLANDPHMAPSMPGIWYQLEMIAPDYHAAGVAVPGVPLVLIGHNDDLAWGFTTVLADTQDIFVERLTEDGTGGVARPDGKPEEIQTHTEEIAVRGQPAPVQVKIRSTSHGVIVNDILGDTTGTRVDLAEVNTKDLLALRNNLEVTERTVPALYRLNTADSLSEARAAILEIKHSSQNLMLAHRDGGIAWQVSGALPVRGKGLGAFPSPGWEPRYGWQGYFSPDRNPGIANPPGYALVTANNRTVPVDHPMHITRSWMAPYRAERIEELLNSRNPLNAEDLARMQLDRISVQAKRFKQALGRSARELREVDPEARRIADEYLMTWDGNFEGNSRPAALFALLQPALYEHLFGDELGEDLPLLMSIAIISYNALEEALYSGKSSFWDDVRTPEREGAAHIWARALRSAKTELDERMPELGEQRLDRLRHLSFPHAFNRIPLLGPLFGVGPIPVGGDAHVINTMKTYPTAPEEALIVPSMRVVYTPADWSQTRGTLNLGQSGHRFSPYRSDQLEDWLAGRSRPWPWNGPEPGSEIGAMVLKPDTGS